METNSNTKQTENSFSMIHLHRGWIEWVNIIMWMKFGCSICNIYMARVDGGKVIIKCEWLWDKSWMNTFILRINNEVESCPFPNIDWEFKSEEKSFEFGANIVWYGIYTRNEKRNMILPMATSWMIMIDKCCNQMIPSNLLIMNVKYSSSDLSHLFIAQTD